VPLEQGPHLGRRLRIGRVGDDGNIVERHVDQDPLVFLIIDLLLVDGEAEGHLVHVAAAHGDQQVVRPLRRDRVDLDRQARAVLAELQAPGLVAAQDVVGVVVPERADVVFLDRLGEGARPDGLAEPAADVRPGVEQGRVSGDLRLFLVHAELGRLQAPPLQFFVVVVHRQLLFS